MNPIHLTVCILLLKIILAESTPIVSERNLPPCTRCAILTKNKRNVITHQMKKDLFVSRGWGASGMPFNVLYMKSPHTTSHFRSESLLDRPLALAQMQEHPKGARERNMQNNKKGNVKNGTSVPQLFVSYGWGPLGRK